MESWGMPQQLKMTPICCVSKLLSSPTTHYAEIFWLIKSMEINTLPPKVVILPGRGYISTTVDKIFIIKILGPNVTRNANYKIIDYNLLHSTLPNQAINAYK